MTVTATTNQNTILTSTTGGAVRVTCATNVGQGNGGISLPCKGCWVSTLSSSTEPTRVNIGAAASAILGVQVPEGPTGSPLWIPIDDVSKLYFYSGGASDVIDIMYIL